MNVLSPSPSSHTQTSVLAVYLLMMLGVTCYGVIMTVLMIRLHNKDADDIPVTGNYIKLITFLKMVTFTRSKEETATKVEPSSNEPHFT